MTPEDLVQVAARVIPCDGFKNRCGQYDQSNYICPRCKDVARQVVAAVLQAISCELDSAVSALKTARDFIAHHPAVQGEWPLLLGLMNAAIAKLADDE